MRILFVADDLYPGFGGQARATEGHIEALLARGHEVRALAGAEPRPTEPPAGVLVERLPSWRLGAAQTRFAHPLVSRVAPHVRWADVVHANTPAALTAVVAHLARRRGVPVVMGVHTQLETSTLQAPLIGHAVERFLTGWYRYLFGLADLLVTPTPYAARLVTHFTDREPAPVSNGIDLSAWEGLSPRPAGGPVRRLAYVGRLSPEKRPLDLLPLMHELPEHYRLTVAGHGPLEAEMRQAIVRRGLSSRVEMLGYVGDREKLELLCDTEAFLMPSPAELQSIATLEAMASGAAVVAWGYASSAVPSLVEESRGGVVVPPGEPRRQAEAIVALLEDPAALAAARENARAYARTHDVALSAARLEELYEGLVAAARRRAEGAVARAPARARCGQLRGERARGRGVPQGEGVRT